MPYYRFVKTRLKSEPPAPPSIRRLRHTVDQAIGLLPLNGPLQFFHHQNPLRGLEKLPWSQAMRTASRLFRGQTHLAEDEYRSLWDSGRIRTNDLRATVLEQLGVGASGRAAPGVSIVELRLAMLRGPAGNSLDSNTEHANHARAADALRSDVDQLVNEILAPFTAAFCDQGQAAWPMPQRERGFLRAFMELHGRFRIATPRWRRELPKELRRFEDVHFGAMESIADSLSQFRISEDEHEEFLAAALLKLRGWAGLLRRQEIKTHWMPRQLPAGSLVEFLAVRLILERLAARFATAQSLESSEPNDNGEHRGLVLQCYPLRKDAAASLESANAVLKRVPGMTKAARKNLTSEQWRSVQLEMDAFTEFDRRLAFHEAFEAGLRQQMLGALAIRAVNKQAQVLAGEPDFQVVCCLDSCEESWRRHLEEVSPCCQTFGAPGFFDIAMAYRALGDSKFIPHCPPYVKPQHFVEETPPYQADGTLGPVWKTSGDAAQLRCQEDAKSNQACGYSIDEMAYAVQTLLQDIGLASRFAKTVFVVGHGSLGRRDAHAAAHNCSFCGSRSGGPNARVFAAMANDERVRQRLANNGLRIPESTVFVGAEHHTCSDTIEYFDLSRVSPGHRELLEEATNAIEEALERNAHERCRRFESADPLMSVRNAAWHVVDRLRDETESHPEYSFAGNAFCFVGRRSRTQGLFLDRRSFLASYDPTTDDEDSTHLARLLKLVLPSCLSVNLEYFFSRTDPVVFGAGSRNSRHAVAGLGVVSEPAGDLRTGLPPEVVDFHDPVRLLCVVETTPDALLRVLDQLPSLSQLAANSWFHLATLGPESADFHIFRNGFFERRRPEPSCLPELKSSRAWYQNRSGNLSIANIL